MRAGDRGASWAIEDTVAPDASPNDLGLASGRIPELKGCPAIMVFPRHFIDAGSTLNTFDSETWPKSSSWKVLDERAQRRLELRSFLWAQLRVVADASLRALIRRHVRELVGKGCEEGLV